jgi:hypothetical protein
MREIRRALSRMPKSGALRESRKARLVATGDHNNCKLIDFFTAVRLERRAYSLALAESSPHIRERAVGVKFRKHGVSGRQRAGVKFGGEGRRRRI